MTTAIPGLPASRVGPYRIERRLGAGGMGVVYLGYDEHSGVAAAVKLIKPDYVADAHFRDRLRRELLAAQRVPRYCTASVLGADLAADPPWVATEFIDAPSLDVVLLEQGRLPEVELAKFAVGVAAALRAIHQQGVVHRDLKPSNVLLSSMGPRVIDFGIAWVEGADTRFGQLTPTGAVVGTPRYMAPEQLRGEPVTAAVDVFAWAGLVTYAGTGQAPFDAGDDLTEAILSHPPDLGDLPAPLRGLVAGALHKEPAARPSAAGLVERLSATSAAATTQVLSAAAVPADVGSATTVPPAAPAGRWSRRRTLTAFAAVAGGVAAATGTIAGFRWLAGPAAGELVGVLDGHESAVESVALGELDGEPIAISASSFDRTVRVWHLPSGDQIERFAANSDGAFQAVAVGHRDGTPVAVLGSRDPVSMQVWDISSGEPVELPFTDHTNAVYRAGVSSVAVAEWDGAAVVVSGGLDGTVRMWDLHTGDQVGETSHPDAVREGLTFELAVAAGELAGVPIAVAGGYVTEPWATVWDLVTGEPISELTGGHVSEVRAVALGALDGRPVVVSGSNDHMVRVWEAGTGRPIGAELAGHRRHVRSVAFAEVDGSPVAVSGGDDQTVRVWSLVSGEQVGPELVGHSGHVTSVAIGELDGSAIAVSAGGSTDRTVRVWRLPSPGRGG